MHKYVTDFKDIHPANPKPLYKTHKTDGDGNMVNPLPIRNLTCACGTAVVNLSKLMQCSVSHLTTKANLPYRNKSTNEVLKQILVTNREHAPFKPESILTFPDICKMYPNVDTDEAIEII